MVGKSGTPSKNGSPAGIHSPVSSIDPYVVGTVLSSVHVKQNSPQSGELSLLPDPEDDELEADELVREPLDLDPLEPLDLELLEPLNEEALETLKELLPEEPLLDEVHSLNP